MRLVLGGDQRPTAPDVHDADERAPDRRARRDRADAGVPCSAVMDTAELHNDPHLLARDFVQELDLPIHGRVPLLGFAPKLSKSESRLTPPPLLGEHTKEILVEVLGLGIDEVNALQIEGAFGEQAES